MQPSPSNRAAVPSRPESPPTARTSPPTLRRRRPPQRARCAEPRRHPRARAPPPRWRSRLPSSSFCLCSAASYSGGQRAVSHGLQACKLAAQFGANNNGVATHHCAGRILKYSVWVSAATEAAPSPDSSVQTSSDAKCDSSATAATKAMLALMHVATLRIITSSGVPVATQRAAFESRARAVRAALSWGGRRVAVQERRDLWRTEHGRRARRQPRAAAAPRGSSLTTTRPWLFSFATTTAPNSSKSNRTLPTLPRDLHGFCEFHRDRGGSRASGTQRSDGCAGMRLERQAVRCG